MAWSANGQYDPHGWLADDDRWGVDPSKTPLFGPMQDTLTPASEAPPPDPVARGSVLGAGMGARGIGGSFVSKRFGNGPIMAQGGGVLTNRPVGEGTINHELSKKNVTTGRDVSGQVVARQRAREQMMAGGGVRPGTAPTMNAVEAARLARGIGGSVVPSGRNPNDPRNAALAPYPQR